MSESIRRLVSDKPVKSSEADRARIAADVEAFLAAGGRIQEVGTGETSLVNGITKNLLTYGQLGSMRSRKARQTSDWGYGTFKQSEEGQR